MNLSWQFDKRSVDERRGWDDSTIAQFKGNKLKSAVCEVLQNSLDNPFDPNQTSPVIVEFAEISKNRDAIPGVDELSQRLKNCLTNSKHESKSSIDEIKHALDVLNKDQVRCLVITDRNTTGLRGPDKIDSDFHTYMKSEGSSGGSSHRGGSHGHGKAAILAASDLRSIFVSTAWKLSDEIKRLYQGRATFMTHKVGRQIYDPKGYFGARDFRAFDTLPKNLRWLDHPGDEPGTSITVFGWQTSPHWKLRALGYALATYFPAAIRGKLDFRVGDYVLNKSTVWDLLEDSELLRDIGDADPVLTSAIENARLYSKCLLNDSDEEPVSVVSQVKSGIGKSETRLILQENAPKTFAILRNNMFITDSSSNPFFYRRWPASIKDFAGVFECLDTKGNELLRGMEPPQHDNLSPDFLPNNKRGKGERALRQIAGTLKQILKDHATIESGASVQFDWTADFFADEKGDGTEVDVAADIDPNGEFEITPRPRAAPPPRLIQLDPLDDLLIDGPDHEESDDDEDVFDVDVDVDVDDEERDVRPRPKPKPPEERARPSIEISGVPGRAIKLADGKFRIIVRGRKGSQIATQCLEVGAIGDRPLSIVSVESSDGILENGKLLLELEADSPTRSIDVRFDRRVLGALRVICREV